MSLLRTFVFLALTGGAAAAFTPAIAQAQEKPPSVLTVAGEGEVAVVPDLAVLTGGVITAARTAREASEANAKAMTAVMAALKEAGVADGDVQTARLSLQPMRDQNRIGPARITGFQASNQVTIKIRELAKVADIIDRLVAAGANDISGIQFVVSSPSKLLDQAREAAVADARRKAEIYARAANVRL
ncbi:MAG: SIMPL domain-containing protein, partial [Xanthobacteraceae bacterium]